MVRRQEIEILYSDTDLPVVTVHLPDGLNEERVEEIMESAFSLATVTLQAAGVEVISEGLTGNIVDAHTTIAW